MIFQKPNPFAMCDPEKPDDAAEGAWHAQSGPNGTRIAEAVLQDVGLWDEVNDRLHRSASTLSGGSAAAAVHRPGAGAAAPGAADG